MNRKKSIITMMIIVVIIIKVCCCQCHCHYDRSLDNDMHSKKEKQKKQHGIIYSSNYDNFLLIVDKHNNSDKSWDRNCHIGTRRESGPAK